MLEVSGLKKSFGKTVAVDRVDLCVSSGACFGLLGPNGAGKTTAISIIAGTLRADEGEVRVNGLPLTPDTLDVKRQIGYVPQDLALYEDLSAEDNLKFFGMLYGLSGSKLQQRIEAVLEVISLKDRRHGPVRTFSGGMKRRLNIAAALLHDPNLLILDEPTVGVDPQSRNSIFEALEALIARGKTLLYTTHYMEEVERLCSEAAIIDHGQIIAVGDLAELHALVPTKPVLLVDLERPTSSNYKKLRGVVDLTQNGRRLSIELEDLSRDMPPVLSKLIAGGERIDSVQTKASTLEEVFLHLTGRTLRD